MKIGWPVLPILIALVVAAPAFGQQQAEPGDGAPQSDLKQFGANFGILEGKIDFISGNRADVLYPLASFAARLRYTFDAKRFGDGRSGLGFISDLQPLNFSSDAGSEFFGILSSNVVLGFMEFDFAGTDIFVGVGYGLSFLSATARICLLDSCNPAELEEFNINEFFVSYHTGVEIGFHGFFPEIFKIGYQNILVRGRERPGFFVFTPSQYEYDIELRIIYVGLNLAF